MTMNPNADAADFFSNADGGGGAPSFSFAELGAVVPELLDIES